MEAKNKSFIDKGNRSLKGKSSKSKIKNFLAYTAIFSATVFTVGILLLILGFIFVNGFQKINFNFLTNDYEPESNFVQIRVIDNGQENKLGLIFTTEEIDRNSYIVVKEVENVSLANESITKKNEVYPLHEGDIIKKVAKTNVKGISLEEINSIINSQEGDSIELMVTRRGGGIRPMIITTLKMIALSLIIACPIGIFAAIYLTEYAKPGKLIDVIRFATESLAGIPSIIYGLFGMVTFVITLNLKYSILAGALTLAIILLPVIIRQTEESLKAVPLSYREASLGLGATKLYTIARVIVPSAIPGIIVAVILSIGRIVGESAALLLTAGTSKATLTVKAYTIAKEEGDIVTACAIGTVVVIIILILNSLSKIISARYMKTN